MVSFCSTERQEKENKTNECIDIHSTILFYMLNVLSFAGVSQKSVW